MLRRTARGRQRVWWSRQKFSTRSLEWPNCASGPGRRDPQTNSGSGIGEHDSLPSHLLLVFWFSWWIEEGGIFTFDVFSQQKGTVTSLERSLALLKSLSRWQRNWTKAFFSAVSCMCTAMAPENSEVAISENPKDWIGPEKGIGECWYFTVCVKGLETVPPYFLPSLGISLTERMRPHVYRKKRKNKWPRYKKLGKTFLRFGWIWSKTLKSVGRPPQEWLLFRF